MNNKLTGIITSAMDETEGLECAPYEHENEDAALNHAFRLLNLEPGDVVYWQAKGFAPVKALFVSIDIHTQMFNLVVYASDKSLNNGCVHIQGLFFEEQITDDMRACPQLVDY